MKDTPRGTKPGHEGHAKERHKANNDGQSKVLTRLTMLQLTSRFAQVTRACGLWLDQVYYRERHGESSRPARSKRHARALAFR
ncbi:hypothetical protein BRADI_1g07463v3 [Brachypodium distachyon]|uniref:Uncharacterized protein n=1 Tax=Brachypodium distachyon TaxID=15368 RepID=A0A2K2DIH4_BRADI|nr:hypothetical protein BRADI_1g07463v3 [Brachypodium distachyon]